VSGSDLMELSGRGLGPREVGEEAGGAFKYHSPLRCFKVRC